MRTAKFMLVCLLLLGGRKTGATFYRKPAGNGKPGKRAEDGNGGDQGNRQGSDPA